MVVSAHIGTCGQWSNHFTYFPPLLLHNLNILHAFSLKHISSFQLVFKATVQTLFNLLASSLSEHHNRSRLTCAALLVLINSLLYHRACGHCHAHTISSGTCAHSTSHHNTLLPPLYAPFLFHSHLLFLQVFPTVDAYWDMGPHAMTESLRLMRFAVCQFSD